jgi:hemerythrin superfamily protein
VFYTKKSLPTDTKGVIRSRKSNKDKQTNNRKKDKQTNNDLQNNTQKTKDRAKIKSWFRIIIFRKTR